MPDDITNSLADSGTGVAAYEEPDTDPDSRSAFRVSSAEVVGPLL